MQLGALLSAIFLRGVGIVGHSKKDQQDAMEHQENTLSESMRDNVEAGAKVLWESNKCCHTY